MRFEFRVKIKHLLYKLQGIGNSGEEMVTGSHFIYV